MTDVQVPIQNLPYGPYSTRLREWSPNYNAVRTIERDSSTGFRYVVISEVTAGAVQNSLSDLLGVPPQSILDYLDATVVQDHNPPGVQLISIWYWYCTVGAEQLVVMPWQYLYRTVEDLGSVPGV